MTRILVVSDIHYASAEEQRRPGYEWSPISRPLPRHLLRFYRRHIWLRDPFAHNALLDQFLDRAGEPDLVVGNGDFSCDSAFIGVADDAAAESTRQCLERLRLRFGSRFLPVLGDHELGKVSLVGGRGGLRMASWCRATRELGISPLWRQDLGSFTVLGLSSTLLALPVYLPETLSNERAAWQDQRAHYLQELIALLAAIPPHRQLILFVHDPTALPYLAEMPAVRARLDQVVATIIGHLHSPLVLWKSRLLAGLPPIHFLGTAIRRMSQALNRARSWRPFRVHLCPSLAGIELLKDGGFLELHLPEDSTTPVEVRSHRIWRLPKTVVC